MKMITCVVFLGLFVLTAVTSAAEPAVSVSIAEPSRDVGERYVEYGGSNSHFHVVVTNVSNKPQRIWATSFSEGYLALSFEVTNKNGKKWVAKRKDRNWMRNAPRWWILEPSEHLVIDVYFWDSTEWVGFPRAGMDEKQVLSIRAVFSIDSHRLAEEHGIWTGRVASASHQYSLLYRE